MQLKDSQQTLVVLANGAELVRVIAQGVMGNEVSNMFAGAPISRSMLYNLAQTQFQASVAKYLGGA